MLIKGGRYSTNCEKGTHFSHKIGLSNQEFLYSREMFEETRTSTNALDE